MNYHNIEKCSCSNGEGVRLVLWVSGCIHACKGCHNQQTWDPESGITFDGEAIEEIYTNLADPIYTGITFSGGDPLHPNNRKVILSLAKDIKEKFPNKNIWLYTGFLWENIKDFDGIENIDVIIDGKYVEELSNPSPKWRGSSNQRIIDVKATINSSDGEVVLHDK